MPPAAPIHGRVDASLHQSQDASVRTTVTIDPDVEALLTRAMKRKGISFKEALNTALRLGLPREQGRKGGGGPLRVFDMRARADLNLDKALQLASELEDEETLRKFAQGR
jgi:hypothetical protein